MHPRSTNDVAGVILNKFEMHIKQKGLNVRVALTLSDRVSVCADIPGENPSEKRASHKQPR